MGLGLGMDLQWGKGGDIVVDANGASNVKPALLSFLREYGEDFESAFFSFQPRTSDLLFNEASLAPVIEGFQKFKGALPRIRNWGLHHTFLNLGTLEEDYPRESVANLTNRVTSSLGLEWVNEDLGLWSLLGKNLAYPLPPILSQEGLRASCENISFYKSALAAQLRVEFPGFSEGHTVVLGKMCALEFFRECIDRTGVASVFDTGHILSYQWRKGRRGSRMFESLDELLPFDSCVEIHLSGCSIVGERFVDFHHGIIQDEQFALLEFLLERCKRLKTVTYEDPKFLDSGVLIPKSVAGFERLKERMGVWKSAVVAT